MLTKVVKHLDNEQNNTEKEIEQEQENEQGYFKIKKFYFVMLLFVVVIAAAGITTIAFSFGDEPAVTVNNQRDEFNKLYTAYDTLMDSYYKDLSSDDLVNGAIDGMFTALDDPYSDYMNEEEAASFQQSISSSFEGIGAEIQQLNDSIVVVTPEYDPDHNPVIISVRPNGHGKHDRDDTASNFVTGMYGKDNFVNFLNRTIEQKKLLYAHKEKSQELFRVLGLQSSKGVNNLSFDTIIHQSRNIVKSFSDNSQNAKIAVEEYGVDKETNKRLYNIREIETKTAKDIGFTNDSLRHSFLNGSTTSISELFKLVKTFDKGFYLNKRGNAEREELSAEETQSKTETAEYIDHINDDGQVSMFGNGEIAEANRAQKQKED